MAQLIRIAGKWYSDFRQKGKRIRRALHRDKREAERMLRDMLDARDAERTGRAIRDISWQMFKAKYLEYSSTKAPHTHYRDRLSIGNLERHLNLQRLSHVTPELLEQLKAKWSAAGKRPHTVNREIKALKAMMRKAEAWGYMPAQHWRTVKHYKTAKGRIHFWSLEESNQLLASLKNDWYTFAFIGLNTGLRLSELLHLTPEDIDFERKRLTVQGHGDWQPKDYEKRWVPVPASLLAHVKPLLTRDPLIFDRVMTMQVASAYFRKLVRKAGLKGSAHTMRHTYASHLVMKGVDLRTLQQLLGHESIRTTEIYAHLAASHLDAAVERLPAFR